MRISRNWTAPIRDGSLEFPIGGHLPLALYYKKDGESFSAEGSLPVQSSASVTLISRDWTKLSVNDRVKWIRTEYRILFDK